MRGRIIRGIAGFYYVQVLEEDRAADAVGYPQGEEADGQADCAEKVGGNVLTACSEREGGDGLTACAEGRDKDGLTACAEGRDGNVLTSCAERRGGDGLTACVGKGKKDGPTACLRRGGTDGQAILRDVVYECRAKGIFRKDGMKPLPGDYVELDVLDEEEREGNVRRILSRKNALIRPAVANVDQALVILAAANPEPNLNLLDRFLITMEQQGIPCCICFNKRDLAGEGELEKLAWDYRIAGYPVLFTSAVQQEGLGELQAILQNRTTAVAGPSGVGKSSLINGLQDGILMETGEVSAKIKRGRHTTRHSELICIRPGTYIVDTPGFSSIELAGVYGIEKEELAGFFPEFSKWEAACRFSGCAHLREPGCGVKKALAEGKIGASRYADYCLLYDELKDRRKY